jgi:hypothetical protein
MRKDVTELGYGPVAEFMNTLMKFSHTQNAGKVLNK